MKKVKKIRYFIEYLALLLILQVVKIFGEHKSLKVIKYLLQKGKNFIAFTKVARKNIDLIYNLPKDEREALIHKLYENFAFFIVEIAIINTLTLQEIRSRVNIEGMEYIKTFQEKKQPFLIMTGHFANWEIALAVLNSLYPNTAAVYRKINNPYIDKFFYRQRRKFSISLIPKGIHGSKELVKTLKQRKAIAMLIDQKMNEGINVPLMGVKCMTSDSMAKIALNFQYPIVPIQIIRLGNLSKFCVKIHPPLVFDSQIKQDDNIYNITTQINQILGEWINQHPEQWLWFHRRWNKH